MANSAPIRHWVSIAGKLIDKSTRLPLAGAELKLIEGPDAFQDAVAIRSRDPLWLQRKVRLNHTVSRGDGLFYFLDLPPGGPYRIQVTVPQRSAYYGRQVHEQQIEVVPGPQTPTHRIEVQWVEIALVSTGAAGKVVTTFNGAPEPVARARVSLQEATTVTDAAGAFHLDGLIGPREDARLATPKPLLKVEARGFATAEQEIELQTGQVVEDITIELDAA